MKKKLFCLLLLLVLPVCLLFTGCNANNDYTSVNDTRFHIIEYNDKRIYVDKETKVMYFWVKNGYGGGLTVMLNADGKPLLYEGEL